MIELKDLYEMKAEEEAVVVEEKSVLNGGFEVIKSNCLRPEVLFPSIL